MTPVFVIGIDVAGCAGLPLQAQLPEEVWMPLKWLFERRFAAAGVEVHMHRLHGVTRQPMTPV